MTTNIFLQARVNSQRFPKKILKKIYGKSILNIIFDRIKLVQNIDKIILVTGTPNLNNELIDIARKLKMDYFCGNEENVLDRFYHASLKYPSDNIIRITCDNPLIDFNIINECLESFTNNQYDVLYVDNHSLFPEGLNFEIFSQKALQNTWESNLMRFSNKDEFEKTFISPGVIFSNPNLKKFAFKSKQDYTNLRLTMDFEEDFKLIQKIFDELYPKNPNFILNDIISLLSKKPELIKINEKYNRHLENFHS